MTPDSAITGSATTDSANADPHPADFGEPARAVGQVGAVVVTYTPGENIRRLTERLLKQTPFVVVVDNGSPAADVARLQALSSELGFLLIANGLNRGVAAALNQGVERVRQQGQCNWVALFDQDSEPFVSQLYELARIASEYPDPARLGNVGSNFLYAANNLPVFPLDSGTTNDQNDWVPSASPITSGSLISLQGFTRVGGFREELFIDYVDYDYALRLKNAGFDSVRSRQPLMRHAIGQRVVGSVLGKRVTASGHRPERRYFMMRNLVIIAREQWRHHPALMRTTVLRYGKELLAMTLVEHKRPAKWTFTVKGLFDGLLGRFGYNPLVQKSASHSSTQRFNVL